MRSLLAKITACVLLIAALPGRSQNSEYLVTINPATGVHTRIDSIPGVLWIMSNGTVDKFGNRYFFLSKNGANILRLNTINATSGAIISCPPLVMNGAYTYVGELHYDYYTGTIRALATYAPTQVVDFIAIDPATAAITVIAPLSGVQAMSMGQSTFDQGARRYFFGGLSAAGMRFYTIDADNGTILSMPLAPSNVFPFLPCHNNATGKLFALKYPPQGTGINVEQVNPATLSSTLVANIPAMTGIVTVGAGATGTIDESTNRFTFLMPASAGNYSLYTVDLTNGNVVYSPPFFPATYPAPVSILTGTNMGMPKYNSNSGVLYALHWGPPPSVVTGQGGLREQDISFEVSPNPFSERCVVVFREQEEGRLRIFNATGSLLREERFYNAGSVEIPKKDLAPGLYFIHLSLASGTTIKKIIIE